MTSSPDDGCPAQAAGATGMADLTELTTAKDDKTERRTMLLLAGLVLCVQLVTMPAFTYSGDCAAPQAECAQFLMKDFLAGAAGRPGFLPLDRLEANQNWPNRKAVLELLKSEMVVMASPNYYLVMKTSSQSPDEDGAEHGSGSD